MNRVAQKEEDFKLRGRSVTVRNDDFNSAFRKFKKKVQNSGILQDLKEREFYVKNSDRRKKAKAAARARWLKKSRELNTPRDWDSASPN